MRICILKRYNNFKCAVRQRETLFAQSIQKFGKVTVARYEFGVKHRLTLEINQVIFIKNFENTSPCLDKIYTFSQILKAFFK